VDQKPVYLIGRNAVACDIVLNHCSVSRLHAAVLHHEDGAAYLVDMGSCHGTFLDDIRLVALQPTLLVHGATLKFGASSRTYAFKTFESRDMIIERVQSRIGLAPDEVEVEQNTLLNRALSYRLGFSIPLSHQATPRAGVDAEGDEAMAPFPLRQIEPSTSVSALIRRTQSEDSSTTGAFALTAASSLPCAKGASKAQRKRSRAQSAGLPATGSAAQLPSSAQQLSNQDVYDDDDDSDGNSKRVHFCERPAETIPPRAAYFSPEVTPVSSASSSPQIAPETDLPLPKLTIAKTSETSPTTTTSRSSTLELPRPSPPPLMLLGRNESCSVVSSSTASEQKKASHEVAG
jgi:hypothetical protein